MRKITHCTALLMTGTVLAMAAPGAEATILPPISIDGPSPAVGELGGVAQAEDGTGGVAYVRTEGGNRHIYAARFDGRTWSAPQRLDTGLPYDSFSPRIAAASDGRLVAVWAQRTYEGIDALYSAVLPRGGTRWQAPTMIDFNIGPAELASPSLAMNPGGAALVAYRAVDTDPNRQATLPAGTVAAQIRVARFDGTRWQKLGVPANRNVATPVPAPSGDNQPRIAIDDTGNGSIAWQEPDDDFVPRIWARRIFGTRYTPAQAVSPLQVDGQADRGGADRPALAETATGRVVVAYRQLPDPRTRGGVPQQYVRQMKELASTFDDPVALGDAGDATPSLDLDQYSTTLGFAHGGVASFGFAPVLPGDVGLRDQDAALAAPAPVAVAGLAGRSVLASASEAGGGEVAVREIEGTQVVARRPASADPGGPIRELTAAGSGRGDALVAFTQGVDGDRQVAVSVVDTPPAPFWITSRTDWARQRTPELTWTPAYNSLGDLVIYTVYVDGRRVGRTRATGIRLREGTVDQGEHVVRVVATDSAGQQTVADPASYKLDRQAPVAAVSAKGRRVVLRLRDPGGKRRASGVADGESSVAWGDGRSSDGFTGYASHRFRKGGTFTLSISTADDAGNRLVVKRAVRVR
jgi:hypothetical protein